MLRTGECSRDCRQVHGLIPGNFLSSQRSTRNHFEFFLFLQDFVLETGDKGIVPELCFSLGFLLEDLGQYRAAKRVFEVSLTCDSTDS
jgi:hypothetical protein